MEVGWCVVLAIKNDKGHVLRGQRLAARRAKVGRTVCGCVVFAITAGGRQDEDHVLGGTRTSACVQKGFAEAEETLKRKKENYGHISQHNQLVKKHHARQSPRTHLHVVGMLRFMFVT